MTQNFEDILARWGNTAGLSRGAGASLTYQTNEGSVEIQAAESPEVVQLSHVWQAPAWLARNEPGYLPSLTELARSFANQRDALLSATANGDSISIVMPLYLEGISRQAFMSAVAEVARTVVALDALAADLDTHRGAISRAQAETQQAPAYEPEPVQQTVPTANVCRGCGKTLAEGMRFCDNCGTPVA